MGNVLEFYIKLKDMMSSGLAKVAQVAKEKGMQIASVFKQVESSIDSATAKNQKFARSFDDAGKSGMRFGNIMRQVGIGLSIASLVAFTKDSLMQSAQAENQRIAFKVLLGSKIEGEALYGKIRAMADVTPFQSSALMRSGKTLLGFGEKKANIMPDLQHLGDIASAQDDPTQSLVGLSHAYGEVIASGRLLGRNTLEMINWGFNPLKEISKMTGKSMLELRKEEERGAISVDMVRKAFEHATGAGGKFHNMMKEQADTLSGRWSTFMDLVNMKMRNFGDSLAPIAKQIMSLFSRILNAGGPSEWKKFTDETDKLHGLRIELGLSNTTNQRRMDIFNELKSTYPSVVANIKNEKEALDKLIPSLDAYLNKRYIGDGILKIKQQYSADLQAVDEATQRIPETYGQGVALSSILAGKYGVNADGKSAGQLTGAVQGKLQELLRTGKSHTIYEGGTMVNQEAKDLLALQSLITQNKEAQKLYDSHIAGANKAREAIERFNKVMGIKPEATGGTGKEKDGGDGADIAGGIARGGPRIININGGVKFTDKFEMHVTEFKGGVDQVKEVFQDMLLRVLNSGASVQQ